MLHPAPLGTRISASVGVRGLCFRGSRSKRLALIAVAIEKGTARSRCGEGRKQPRTGERLKWLC